MINNNVVPEKESSVLGTVTIQFFVVVSSPHILNMKSRLGHRPRPIVGFPIKTTLVATVFMPIKD